MCSVFQLAADECLVDICCQCDFKVSANVWRFVVFFFIQLLDLEHKYGQAVPCLPPPHQQPNMLCSCFTCSDNIVFYIYETMRACGCVLSATRLKYLPFALQLLWLAFAPPCWSTKKLSRRTGPFSTPYVTTRQTPCSSRELFKAPARRVLRLRRCCTGVLAIVGHVLS